MESLQKKNFVKLLLLLSSVGWAIALYLVWHGAKLTTVGLDGPSICHLSDFLNCDAVALSDHSKMWGIPVAAFLAAFYSLVLIFSLVSWFSLQDNEGRSAHRAMGLIFIGSALFSAVSLYQAYISIFVLKAVCVFCFAAYIINILILALSWKFQSKQPQLVNKDSLRHASSTWIFAGLLIVFHLILPRMFENSMSDVQREHLDLAVRNHINASPRAFIVDGYPSKGASAEDAVLTIVEYSDYQCPYCMRTYKMLEPYINAHSNSVRLIFKPFPLDPACNAGIQGAGHPFSCQASKISLCLYQQSGEQAFKQFHASVFNNQSSINSTSIRSWAQNAGMSEEQISECLQSERIHQMLVDSVQEGGRNGVQGTPSFFINNKRLQIVNPQSLNRLIQHYRNEHRNERRGQ